MFSNEFPSPTEPNRGIFTGQLALALSRQVNLEVVCPSPWKPGRRKVTGGSVVSEGGGGSRRQYWKGIPVKYIRYPMIPLLGRPIQPALLCLGVYLPIMKAHRQQAFTAINVHWIYPDGVAMAWVARRLGIPVVITALGSDVNQYSFYRSRRPQVLWAFRRASRATCVSGALRDQLIRLGVEAHRIDVIPNGIDNNLFNVGKRNQAEAKRELDLDQKARHLLYVGRLSPEKGPLLLCQALRILSDSGQLGFKTLFVGDGPEKESLKKYICAHQLGAYMRLAGEVPHQKIPRWMEASDWLCLPSIQEGLPNAMLEALSCGLPVIASRVGGVPEVVTHRTGILVQPGNPEALAGALQKAVRRDWDHKVVAGTVTDYSWDKAAFRYVQAISQALEYERHLRFGAAVDVDAWGKR